MWAQSVALEEILIVGKMLGCTVVGDVEGSLITNFVADNVDLLGRRRLTLDV